MNSMFQETQTIRAVVKGMLVTAIVQGLLAGTAYVAVNVPFPMGLTALSFINDRC